MKLVKITGIAITSALISGTALFAQTNNNETVIPIKEGTPSQVLPIQTSRSADLTNTPQLQSEINAKMIKQLKELNDSLKQLENQFTNDPILSSPYFSNPDVFNFPTLPEQYGTQFNAFPQISYSSTENDYVLKLVAPGLTKKDFNIQLENSILTISSNQCTEQKTTNDKKVTSETKSTCSFSQSISVPSDANTKAITANYADGTLIVVIPREKDKNILKAKDIQIN